MSKRTDRMYKDSPHMERDKESGSMKATKKPEMEHAREAGTPGGTMEEGLPPVARHVMERRDMHSRHETEHMVHDHGKGGSKEEMHKRHLEEHKVMHKKHEKEMAEGVKAPAGEKETKPKEKEGGDEKPKEKKTDVEKD